METLVSAPPESDPIIGAAVVNIITPKKTPIKRVAPGKGYGEPYLEEQFSAVAIPDDAKPSSDTDQEMVIYQPSSDQLWEMWEV
jgi:hypothetical protein